MPGAVSDVIGAIGNTPIVRLNHVSEGIESDIYVKLEYLNPAGSMKDRIALNIIEDAERRGTLGPGGTIVEATSGNTGAGLAMIATMRGYKYIRDARQNVGRKSRLAARLWCQSRDLSNRRRT